MIPFIYFVDEIKLLYLNRDAKVYDFINQETNHSLSSLLPPNILVDIKAVLVPCSSMEDRVEWGFSQDGNFILKSTTWAMRKKPLVHHNHKVLN